MLPARGSVIGLLAIEHSDDHHFTDRDVELLRGFVEPVALAIDNARWFARLRTVGADEERTRIARDLHDRIGQSLAYLAFELDRIVDKETRARPSAQSLEQLRDDVRGVIREVRDTLYDLRTDVSDAHDLADTLEAFVDRVRERSKLSIDLFCDRDARLPLLQEREMWRIAQEALTNVERHAQADRVRVLWRCNGDVGRARDHRRRRRLPGGHRGPPRLLRHPGHAGAGLQHRAPPSTSPASRARAPGCAAAWCGSPERATVPTTGGDWPLVMRSEPHLVPARTRRRLGADHSP